MKTLSGIFVKGLVALLPAVVTISLVIWLGTTTEEFIANLIKPKVGDYYKPGMGLAVGVVVAFIAGILMQAILIRKLVRLGERLLNRIPVVKTIYSATKDLMSFVERSREDDNQQVVMVEMEIGGIPSRIMGLVTRNEFCDHQRYWCRRRRWRLLPDELSNRWFYPDYSQRPHSTRGHVHGSNHALCADRRRNLAEKRRKLSLNGSTIRIKKSGRRSHTSQETFVIYSFSVVPCAFFALLSSTDSTSVFPRSGQECRCQPFAHQRNTGAVIMKAIKGLGTFVGGNG